MDVRAVATMAQPVPWDPRSEELDAQDEAESWRRLGETMGTPQARHDIDQDTRDFDTTLTDGLLLRLPTGTTPRNRLDRAAYRG